MFYASLSPVNIGAAAACLTKSSTHTGSLSFFVCGSSSFHSFLPEERELFVSSPPPLSLCPFFSDHNTCAVYRDCGKRGGRGAERADVSWVPWENTGFLKGRKEESFFKKGKKPDSSSLAVTSKVFFCKKKLPLPGMDLNFFPVVLLSLGAVSKAGWIMLEVEVPDARVDEFMEQIGNVDEQADLLGMSYAAENSDRIFQVFS